MLLGSGLFCCFISILTYSVYMVALKPVKHRILTLFWINCVAYLGYITIYFFRKLHLEHDVRALEQLLFTFTLSNVPLYILMACFFVGSFVLLNYLMDHFEISLITPVTEISILFTTIGYLLLGNPFSWIVMLSVSIIFIGAITSGMKTLSLANPFKDLKRIPRTLIAGGTLQAFFESSAMLITFLCTHQTNVNKAIFNFLNIAFKNIYDVPFSFHQPFYYNVGVRFFIVLIFTLYLLIHKKYRMEIITHPFENTQNTLTLSLVFLISIVAYQTAYQDIPDKNVLVALRKLTIPTILFISYYTLGERITRPKLIGCIIIVLGGMLSLTV